MEKKCTVGDCRATHLARGMCRKHYYRWTRANASSQTAATCSESTCCRPVWAKGLCEAHRKRALRGKSVDGPVGRHANQGHDCAVETCGRPARARGLCATHYQRQWAGQPLTPNDCTIDGCKRPQTIAGNGHCAGHDHAIRLYGSATSQGTRTGSLDRKGYRVVRINGQEYKEHRLIMEQLLGRPLLPSETVHHCNTVRHDNRTNGPLDADFRSGNLQLWSKSQPSGGRVTDKVAWAVELLELYAPELLAQKPVQLRLAT